MVRERENKLRLASPILSLGIPLGMPNLWLLQQSILKYQFVKAWHLPIHHLPKKANKKGEMSQHSPNVVEFSLINYTGTASGAASAKM